MCCTCQCELSVFACLGLLCFTSGQSLKELGFTLHKAQTTGTFPFPGFPSKEAYFIWLVCGDSHKSHGPIHLQKPNIQKMDCPCYVNILWPVRKICRTIPQMFDKYAPNWLIGSFCKSYPCVRGNILVYKFSRKRKQNFPNFPNVFLGCMLGGKHASPG